MIHTLDISSAGARVGALREPLDVGHLITLTRGAQKAEFRVVWVKQFAPHEFHAGLEMVHTQDDFWGADLNKAEIDAQERPCERLGMKLRKGAEKP